jgi:apolipoprotein N-acyltransferase
MPQELKWRSSMRSRTVENNLASIREAIDENYNLVILPESVFPLFLNYHPVIEEELRKLSEKIAIITGALYEENGNNYNVSYFFHKGEMQIAKKMILVPFGEYIPLPKFIRSWVNDAFFGGSSDYVAAKQPTDFDINGVLFRSAVCYEATREELYEDNPKYVAAMSNNAWFQPSIEPTLQKLLMHYYARRHGTIIYHSANMGGSGVIY